MATYLFLINNAPLMGVYHKALGDELKKNGHDVIYAFTDIIPIETYNLDLKDDEYYVFSEYFRKNETQPLCDEKYLNINLWKTYFCDFDRYIVHYKYKTYGTDYYQKLLNCLVNFFDEIIKKHNIAASFYECISNSFAFVAYEVGLLNNVNYIGYVDTRLANRFEIQKEEFGIDAEFKKEFLSIDLSLIGKDEMSEVEKYLEKYNSDSVPLYQPTTSILSTDYSLSKRYLNNEKLMLLKGAFAAYRKERKNGFKYLYQTQNPLKMYFNLFSRQIIRRFRAITAKNQFDAVDPQDKFFLFPLHMKPEASTSILSRHYCDDLALITNIAFNLPFGYKLYVKEHTSNLGNQPFEFYEQIKRIPNVKLLHSSENTIRLLKKCEAVITLTSTMGMEALLMGKKVVIFGNVFYEVHPNCIKLTNYEHLFSSLRDIVTQKDPVKDLEEISKKFVATYRKITFPGSTAFSFYETFDLNRFTSVMVPHFIY